MEQLYKELELLDNKYNNKFLIDVYVSEHNDAVLCVNLYHGGHYRNNMFNTHNSEYTIDYVIKSIDKDMKEMSLNVYR